MTLALFAAFPQLKTVLPHVSLCELPTPVQALHPIGSTALYVKRDDISAPLFGGNKVRALEFLLGVAQHRHVSRAIVAGLPGTSMALASAFYSKQQRVNLAVVLIAQQPTEEAKRNLLIFQELGAELYMARTVPAIPLRLAHLMFGGMLAYQKLPFMMNPNSFIGMTGYVNMGFELRDQIQQGLLPEPDRIYIPMGLRGTATGLLLGLRAAGLKSQLVAVAVHPHDQQEIVRIKGEMVKKAHVLNLYLGKHDPSFPHVDIPDDAFEIQCDAPGQSVHTLADEGYAAIESVNQSEGIRLEATWTALAWAAMQRDVLGSKTKQPLFWHTANSQPVPMDISRTDYHQLPKAFHSYFETPVTLRNKPFFAKD